MAHGLHCNEMEIMETEVCVHSWRGSFGLMRPDASYVVVGYVLGEATSIKVHLCLTVGPDADYQVLEGSRTRERNVQLAMSKDRVREVNTDFLEGLALGLVNGHGIGQPDGELSPAKPNPYMCYACVGRFECNFWEEDILTPMSSRQNFSMQNTGQAALDP